MGFRFRKSFGKGPFRVTISNAGVSTSFGVKGARITKRADGRTQGTVGIPGTGVYYTKDITPKQSKTPSKTPAQLSHAEDSMTGASYGGDPTNKPGCLKAFIIGVAVIFLLALFSTCGAGGEAVRF